MNNRIASGETERLHFLARVVKSEALHLGQTSQRLFGDSNVVTVEQVTQWIADIDTSERLDAFVARFARLQDTVGDKLIPALLRYVGENIGPTIDNLDRAEKFGWIRSADEWMVYRKLRNQMIHEYIDDMAVLADALDAGRTFTGPLIQMAEDLVAETRRRVGE